MALYGPVENELDTCDRCAERGILTIMHATEHFYNPMSGQSGYSKYTDLCLPCGKEEHVDNCGTCGGVMDADKLVQEGTPWPMCPACAAKYAANKEEA